MRKVSRKAFLENAAIFKRDMKAFENTKNKVYKEFGEIYLNGNPYHLNIMPDRLELTNYFKTNENEKKGILCATL